MTELIVNRWNIKWVLALLRGTWGNPLNKPTRYYIGHVSNMVPTQGKHAFLRSIERFN
jgi:hypothetical protein